MDQKTNEILERLRDELEGELTEAYKSPVVALEKFQKALMGKTPKAELSKLLYDALIAINDGMTSTIRGFYGPALRTAASKIIKVK